MLRHWNPLAESRCRRPVWPGLACKTGFINTWWMAYPEGLAAVDERAWPPPLLPGCGARAALYYVCRPNAKHALPKAGHVKVTKYAFFSIQS